jgi:hypothetical protein
MERKESGFIPEFSCILTLCVLQYLAKEGGNGIG